MWIQATVIKFNNISYTNNLHIHLNYDWTPNQHFRAFLNRIPNFNLHHMLDKHKDKP